MRRLAFGLAYGIGGYILGALLGYALVLALSSNRHDRELEAVMTAAFVAGPLCGLIAAGYGGLRAGRTRPST
ncbi:MAG: hypothetical protein AB7P18_14835 [Candidatus Binatia bacterium]